MAAAITAPRPTASGHTTRAFRVIGLFLRNRLDRLDLPRECTIRALLCSPAAGSYWSRARPPIMTNPKMRRKASSPEYVELPFPLARLGMRTRT